MPVATPQSQKSNRTQLAISIAVVGVALLLGCAFVWWYFAAAPTKIKFTPDELANLQDAGRQLTYTNTPGTPVPQQMRRGNAQLFIAPTAPPPDPDGVFTIGNLTIIRAGQTLIRVQPPAAAGQAPTLIFRQRSWGLLQDPPSFTIARRIAHEEPLAKQLAVTTDQLSKLNAVVATPPLKGAYLTSLPLAPEAIGVALKAWNDYVAALSGADKTKVGAATDDMLASMKAAGTAALAHARKDYADADNTIQQVLSAAQIDAYHNGRTLTP